MPGNTPRPLAPLYREVDWGSKKRKWLALGRTAGYARANLKLCPLGVLVRWGKQIHTRPKAALMEKYTDSFRRQRREGKCQLKVSHDEGEESV